jgi:hypothetical protein
VLFRAVFHERIVRVIRDITLALFGWIPIGDKFVQDGKEYISLCLRDRGLQPDSLPSAAGVALSQLAYVRAAEKDEKRVARWRNYVRQMEAVSEVVAQALTGHNISDDRIRSILLLHRLI